MAHLISLSVFPRITDARVSRIVLITTTVTCNLQRHEEDKEQNIFVKEKEKEKRTQNVTLVTNSFNNQFLGD